jgi:4-hydroxy-4-methyl-2-oxoglutarate aldolase
MSKYRDNVSTVNRTRDTATIYNVLKGLDRAEPGSYTGPELRPLAPYLGRIGGYALTSEWTAGDSHAVKAAAIAFLSALVAAPTPPIVGLAVVGERPGRSGIAGDGMMREFQVLGAVGTVVAGSVMDVVGIERLAFPVYATGVVPAYDDLRMRAFGRQVEVGPMRIATGDLLVADRAGVVRVPVDAAEAVVAAVPAFRALESSMVAMLDVPGVTAADIRAWYAANEPEFLGGDEPSSNTLRRVLGRDTDARP